MLRSRKAGGAPRRGRYTSVLAAGGAAVVVAITSCTASPPPPIESTGTVTPTAAPPAEMTNEVVVAIDDIGLGFNPHLLSHLSPVSRAVADLVLPSPFRPVHDPAMSGGVAWEPDPSLIVSADVIDDGTGELPFTVEYVLRNEAQWSDAAPIAAEDFQYLWRQMTTQPGVVDPAGYDLIEAITSSSGGKTVNVRFREPYPAWRELFTHLLPAHLIKDSPGGFDAGLTDTIPVSGSRFHIDRVDRGRDDIRLERNDRFWGVPAQLDQIQLRRGGTSAQIADTLRSQDAQIADVHGGGALQAQLSAIAGLETARSYQTRSLQLVLNTRVTPLDSADVRTALLSFLDPDVLATVGGGGAATVAPDRAQILPPSSPEYVSTAPARPRYEDALFALNSAGYEMVDGVLREGGIPTGSALTIVIGVPAGDEAARAVANTAADQLRQVGVRPRVTQMAPARLYGEALSGGEVDAVVGWVQAGYDPATVLASRWACPPPRPDADAPDLDGEESDDPAERDGSRSLRDVMRAPSNLSGACVPELADLIESVLTGRQDLRDVLPGIESQLWQLGAVLPILQDVTLLAVTDSVAGVQLDVPVPVGMFTSASEWVRLPE
ncbi:ABC transporter family substrate-binding protein [Hoyosella altamirensis]|uniref:ABC-type transport system substrate-binding protein n=1 Tax=Hoyosella altamirensis TaxID=616997 RepID=A0A839RIH7_9ACTN|nr:ABC transporter family substrate-binding protein [Hoyosella altamirensis]MBB3036079.1 ABC-type transport system substrate-binding protein [Hoyosella altamirensis]